MSINLWEIYIYLHVCLNYIPKVLKFKFEKKTVKQSSFVKKYLKVSIYLEFLFELVTFAWIHYFILHKSHYSKIYCVYNIFIFF